MGSVSPHRVARTHFGGCRTMPVRLLQIPKIPYIFAIERCSDHQPNISELTILFHLKIKSYERIYYHLRFVRNQYAHPAVPV